MHKLKLYRKKQFKSQIEILTYENARNECPVSKTSMEIIQETDTK
jgi:hypothetical protein